MCTFLIGQCEGIAEEMALALAAARRLRCSVSAGDKQAAWAAFVAAWGRAFMSLVESARSAPAETVVLKWTARRGHSHVASYVWHSFAPGGSTADARPPVAAGPEAWPSLIGARLATDERRSLPIVASAEVAGGTLKLLPVAGRSGRLIPPPAGLDPAEIADEALNLLKAFANDLLPEAEAGQAAGGPGCAG
jgi:hypothetical protein